MSTKTVLSIGQCRPDSAAIAHYLKSGFSVSILTADLADQAMKVLKENTVHLVLINRVLDADASDGMAILNAIRQNPDYASIPVMLVTNYPDWQQKAIAAGAIHGFGKAELNRPETRTRLAAVLS